MSRAATTIEEGQILNALARVRARALVVGDLKSAVRRLSYHNDRQHSYRVSSICLSLESRGLIVRLDSEKPIVWKLP